MADVNPEDFGAVRTGPRPEDFGAVPIDAEKKVKEQSNPLGMVADALLGATPGLLIGKKIADNFATEEGAPTLNRAAASFKTTPMGKFNYYKSVFGDENVKADPKSGEVSFRHPGDNKWHPIDEKGLSWGDLADFAGDIPGMVGMAGGGAVGSMASPIVGVVGAGAGAAVGNAVKQGIGEMIPGDEKMSAPERVLEGVKQGVIGAGSEAAALGVKAIGELRPDRLISRWVARQLEKQGGSEFAQESQRLQAATGLNFRASQETMNPDIALMEGFSERNPFGKTIFKKADIANQNVAQARLSGLISRSGGQLDEPGLGESIANSAGRVLNDLIENRAKQGEQFKLLDTAAGGRPIFDLSNFRNYLLNEGQRFASPGMSKTAQEYGAKLTEKAGEFEGPASARGLQDALAQYGDIAYGKAGKSIFKDLESAADRRVAGGAYKALMQDLDQASNLGGTVGPNGLQPFPQGMARLLRAIRDNYKASSGAIDEFKGTMIAKFLDSQGLKNYTDVAEWLPKQNPEAIKNTLKVLETANPEIQNDVVRNLLTKALETGKVDRPIPFDRELALNTLPKDLKVREALFGNHINEKEITDLFSAIQRSTWKAQGQGIPQSPIHTTISAALQLLRGNPTPMAVNIGAPRLVAEWATDPASRAKLWAILNSRGAVQERAQRLLLEQLKQQIAPVAIQSGINSANSPASPAIPRAQRQ